MGCWISGGKLNSERRKQFENGNGNGGVETQLDTDEATSGDQRGREWKSVPGLTAAITIHHLSSPYSLSPFPESISFPNKDR